MYTKDIKYARENQTHSFNISYENAAQNDYTILQHQNIEICTYII